MTAIVASVEHPLVVALSAALGDVSELPAAFRRTGEHLAWLENVASLAGESLPLSSADCLIYLRRELSQLRLLLNAAADLAARPELAATARCH